MANTLKIKRGSNATTPQGQLAEPLFTTDTYDLYIGKGGALGNQRFQKYIASGTSSQFLKGDGTLDSTTYQPTSEKGQNNGYASLDGGGKVPVAQLPNSIMEYLGTWNASTNTPTLADGTGNAGDVYICSVGGTVNFGAGPITFAAGDWVVYSGSVWQKSINSNAVASVNGQTGAVVLYTDDISEDGSPVNLWFTNARARTAISLTTTGTSGAATYDNSTGIINIPQYQGVLTNPVTGTGSANQAAFFTGTNTIVGSSVLVLDGTNIGIGQAAASQKLSVNGDVSIATILNATTDTDKFLVHDGNIIKYRTGAEVLSDIGAQATLTNPVTGSATSGQIAYWNGNNSITGSSQFTFGPQSVFFINNTISAGGIAMNLTSTVNAAANNDIIYGVRISPTFNNLSFTGVTQRALGVFGNVYINGTITSGAWNGSVIGSNYGGAGTVNGILKANGSGVVSAAVAADFPTLNQNTTGSAATLTTARTLTIGATGKTFDGSANVSWTASEIGLTSYLPLSGGTLTGALSGTSATFSALSQNYVIKGGASGLLTSSGIIKEDGTKVEFLYNVANSNQGINLVNSNGSGYGNSINFYQSITQTAQIFCESSVANTSEILFKTLVGGTLGTRLTISSTGAATFSSTITANGGNILSSGATYGIVQVKGSGASTWQMFANPSDEMRFGRSGVGDYLTIANTGAATFSSSVKVPSSSTGGLFEMGSGANANSRSFRLASDVYDWGDFGIQVSNSQTGTTYTNALLINRSGNVGIGSTSPTEKLHLNNSSGTGIFIRFQDTSGGGVYIGGRDERMELYAGGSERMRITSGGVLQIANSSGTLAAIQASERLNVNGTVYATGYFEISDIRKKDVQNTFYSDNINAISYLWKDKSDDKLHIGYAAQQVQQYIPDAVMIGNDGTLSLDYNQVHTWKIAQLEKEILELKSKING